jgi:outer membrane protein X
MLVMAFSTKTFAQKKSEFKPFKVDVSAGNTLTTGVSGAQAGLLFAVEPKYAVIPQLSVGLRLETAISVAGISSFDGYLQKNASVKAASSYMVTGDYYFKKSCCRPFAGAGFGYFGTGGEIVYSTNIFSATGGHVGGMIRGGCEYKHFRAGIEYNIAGKSKVEPSTSTANNGYTVKNSYLGIKVGFCIGGGKRK